MNTEKALDIINDFRGESLTNKFAELKSELIGKTKIDINERKELFDAAIAVKNASAQTNEIVHAIGIINTLPKILLTNEKVENLSLAAGAGGNGFDLETDKRIAEFKFSRWQEGSSKNGMRKRHIFADFVNLTILQTEKKKELYTVNANRIIKYFQGNANCTKVLSKSGGLGEKLNCYLNKIDKNEVRTLRELFEISDVKIIDVEEL